MSGHRWRLHLNRFLRWGGAHHKVRRINNPGEVALKLFFIVCVLALVGSLTVVLVRTLDGEPEFRPLVAEEVAN